MGQKEEREIFVGNQQMIKSDNAKSNIVFI